MDIRIFPGSLSGEITAPPSKSAAHRAAICAALACGTSRLSPVDATKDMLATIGAAKALGATAQLDDGLLTLTSGGSIPETAVIDCGESGSTLRFFIPVAAALGVSASFRGHGRLPQRPVDGLADVLKTHGVKITKNENEILNCSGKLTPGVFNISGNVSSQYITGLLFALPLLDGDSEIRLTDPLESRGYVDMTIDALKHSGVAVSESPEGWSVHGPQKYLARDFKIEGDYSSGAFFLCAAALGGKIRVLGLDSDSKQGDSHILSLLSEAGADIRYENGGVFATASSLNGFEADMSQIPDLMPVLAVLAAFSKGTSELYNAGRLRIKESDRLSATAAGLRELGADVSEYPDRLVISGQTQLRGSGAVDSFGDHRIAMAMSIAASYCREPSVILGCESADKSYPGFYRDLLSLGGRFDVL